MTPFVVLGGAAGILVFALDRPGGAGAHSALSVLPATEATETTDAVQAEGTSTSTAIPAPASVPEASTPAASAPDTSTRATSNAAAGTPKSSCRTYVGPTEWNRFGPVQVRASVSASGKICGVKVVQLPTDRRSTRINSAAVPRLISQTIDAQSSNIVGVSGATYTTIGYIDSLQAILDAATR